MPHFKPGKALREAVDARVGAQARRAGRGRRAADAPHRGAGAAASSTGRRRCASLVWLVPGRRLLRPVRLRAEQPARSQRPLVLRPGMARADGVHRARRLRRSAAPSASSRWCRAGGGIAASRRTQHAPRRRQAGRRRPGRAGGRAAPSCIRRAMDFDLQWLLLGAAGRLRARLDRLAPRPAPVAARAAASRRRPTSRA